MDGAPGLADLARTAGAQHGLLLRQQAVDAGLSEAEVDRRRRTGEWVAVRRGVYTPAPTWDGLDQHVGRPRLRALAVSLVAEHPHVLSHDSAALLLGLPVLLGVPERVHLTHAGAQGGRAASGVVHHRAAYADDEVAVADGVRVLGPARTAVDIARDAGARRGLVACDAALRAGTPRSALWGAVTRMRCWPGVTTARRCVELADARSESVGESLLRLLVTELALGEVEPQFGLTADGRSAWADLRVGRHLFEFDGRVKYRAPEDGGLAEDLEHVLWRERRRQAWLTGFGLGMSRVTWVDLTPARWRSTGVRLVREHARTAASLGTSVADLAAYRVPRPGPRAA